MLRNTRLSNNNSVNQLSETKEFHKLPNLSTLLLQTSYSAVSGVATEDINQQLNKIPDTIISLQYSPNEFLTFRVCQAKKGECVKSGTVVSLKCQIAGRSYTLNHEHFKQMSNSECRDLFNYLGINSNQFFRGN